MLVAWILTPYQADRAELLCDRAWEWTEGEVFSDPSDLVNCGLYALERGPCTNTDQHLSLEDGVLTYKGQRHPMIQDGALRFILDIFGVDRAQKVPDPDQYKTSDPRLRWWETADDLQPRLRTI